MESVHRFCDDLVTELGGWKAQAHDLVSRIDKVPSGDKEKVIDHVRDFHLFVEELEDRIEGLKVECPVDWEPGRVEMELKLTEKYINY